MAPSVSPGYLDLCQLSTVSQSHSYCRFVNNQLKWLMACITSMHQKLSELMICMFETVFSTFVCNCMYVI